MNADRRMLGALLVCLACTLAAATGAAVAASTDTAGNETSLVVADATVDSDGETEVRVSLSGAPEGLAGFELTLSVGPLGVSEVTGAAYPDTYGLTTDPAVGPDGRTITVEAVDLDGTVEPGASNVTLATVDLSGAIPGTTRLEVVDARIDADGGAPVDPALDAGVVRVEEADTPGGSGTETPQSTTETTTVTSETLSPSTPGFTVAVAFVALATLALLARRD
jgi:PGF-CTERM protein